MQIYLYWISCPQLICWAQYDAVLNCPPIIMPEAMLWYSTASAIAYMLMHAGAQACRNECAPKLARELIASCLDRHALVGHLICIQRPFRFRGCLRSGFTHQTYLEASRTALLLTRFCSLPSAHHLLLTASCRDVYSQIGYNVASAYHFPNDNDHPAISTQITTGKTRTRVEPSFRASLTSPRDRMCSVLSRAYVHVGLPACVVHVVSATGGNDRG